MMPRFILRSSMAAIPCAFAITVCLNVHAAAEIATESLAKTITWEGKALLLRADELDNEAKKLIQKGSVLRKEIKQKRQRVLALENGSERDHTEQQLAGQVELSVNLQQQGANKRKHAAELRSQAVDQFAEDMQQRWPEWIATKRAIQLSDRFQSDAPAVGAHNSRTRSVHPSKQSLAGAPQINTAKSMTLALPELSGQQLPKGLDTRAFAISRERQFVAHIEVDKESVPSADGSIELNQMHRWHLLIVDIDGQLISNASIHYRGHMPGHVHGLPTQPKITDQLADGVYLVSGVKFQMRGWWVIELQLSAEGFAEDSIRFNLSL